MTRLPRLVLVLAAASFAGGAAQASAATVTYPSISKLSPLKLGVGDTMTVRGKAFRSGTGRNTVVFKRDGGRAVFVKAGKATKTQLRVTIPAKMLGALSQKAGKPAVTRFRVRILTSRFGRRYTTAKGSPMIGPTSVTSKVKVDDCDGDLILNAKDPDDDNDLLSDSLETTLKTDPCKRDTDGDGMSDGWEHESAIDYNGKAKPAPVKRPYPNALDAKDGPFDSDGDSMTNAQEYAAWTAFGRSALPLNYSGGEPATGGKVKPAPGREFADRDRNGFLSDNERDADDDGLPNQEEDLVDAFLPAIPATPRDADGRPLGVYSAVHLAEQGVRDIVDFVPLYGQLKHTFKVLPLNWLDGDSDGDSVNDGNDDQDGDGLSNVQELQTEVAAGAKGGFREAPINACEPFTDAPRCLVGDDDIDNDGLPNRTDDDDDGDKLSDSLELSLELNPFKADTDEDGAADGFEYFSAKDLNGEAVPFPSKQPYPNALDKEDGDVDHDGDGLTLVNEFKAWKFTGSPLPLSYSDGNQNTGGGDLDAYKDVDGDGASNFAEVGGPLSGPEYWTAWVKDNNLGCPGGENYVESVYPGPKYQGLDFVDADSDGDGILDGADDADHDGLTNLQESRYVNPENGKVEGIRRADWCSAYVSIGPGPGQNAPNSDTPLQDQPDADRYARTNPFNPCKPVYSAACHKFVPLGYYPKSDTYVEDWAGADPVEAQEPK